MRHDVGVVKDTYTENSLPRYYNSLRKVWVTEAMMQRLISLLWNLSLSVWGSRDAMKISLNAVLLMCGGGRSNTNMMLG